MSVEPTPNAPAPPPNDSLQFDRAEFSETPALACVSCQAPITGQYFQINGQTVCANCRPHIEAAASGGWRSARAFRALGAGIAAAIAGFLIYWGIRAATGYEFGLVAILVGWMVGMAVRKGSQSRGGLFYQLMAVALTYFSIASTYCPDIIQGMRQERADQNAVAEVGENPPSTSETNVAASTESTPAPIPRSESTMPLWFELIFAFCIALIAPFLLGASNFIGWIIIAVGLIQAWSLNKRVPIQVSGPFTLGSQTQVP